MSKQVLIVLAEGFEEIEAVTPADVLRRAGCEVTLAGAGKKSVTGAHGIRFEADVVLEDFRGLPDLVVLPGGMPGAENLRKSAALGRLLEAMKKEGRLIGAICASPAVVLAPGGYLDGRKATCFPGFEGRLGAKITFLPDRVVSDGPFVTSRGPGSALEFSLELVERLVGAAKAAELSQGMLVQR